MSPPLPDSPVTIEFIVDDDVHAAWDTGRLQSLVSGIIERELPVVAQTYTLSLHLVSDTTIRALNADHRAIDRATDVLSFPLHDASADGEVGFVLPPDEPIHLGDVVVSYPRAVEQAADYGHSVEREVAYLVAHGVLHVLGYDHELDSERQVMRQREEEALQPLGFVR
jgi:probable rRNA maturation factor